MARELELAAAVGGYRSLVLDTCVLIEEFCRRPLPFPVLPRVPRGQRCVSVVSLWEFLHGRAGALLGRDERRDRRCWLSDQGIRVLPTRRALGETFSSLIERHVSPPGAVDCLIAADAIAWRVPVVTLNVRDFQAVPSLLLVPVQ